ncbi:MAG: AAA family ATPase, partial [Deltaproteobacteria bacterium]|nr:AAA family ATPase [Deltaproteobacteria bacterium]
MRPLHLTIQAFGPFAERESIDFTRFPERAPFTISGPTGAGKTSVLDALCLALFGETSGGERKAAETRSQYADEKLPTEVRLVFALGSNLWRITRRPARRLGERTEAQSVQLEQQIGAEQWQPSGQRVVEVDNKIRELLGFDVEQFRQVVVLPQGAFRQLLTANSSQREGILKQLFGTHLYERIQKALGEQADALYSDFKTLATRRQTLLAAQNVQNPAELQQKQADAAASLETARAHTTDAAAQRKLADEALQAGQAAAQVLRERAISAQKLADHQAQADQQRLREDTMAAARRAQLAAAQVQLAAAAADHLAKLQRQAAAAQEACDGLVPKLDRATAEVAAQQARKGEREQHLAKAAQLEALKDKVADLETVRSRASQLRLQHDTAKGAVQAGQGRVKQLAADLPKVQAEFQRLQALAAGLASQQAEVDKLVRVKKLHGEALDAATAVRTRQTQAQATAGKRDAAVEAARAALGHYDTCHTDWVNGQAARLAAELRDDQPCPVCGSREHPAPARATGKLPSDQELEQHKQSYEQARAAAERLAREVAEAEARRDAAQLALVKAELALADEALPPEQATDAALRQAQTAVAQAEAARRQLDATQTGVSALQTQLDQARADLAQAETGAADLATRSAAAP